MDVVGDDVAAIDAYSRLLDNAAARRDDVVTARLFTNRAVAAQNACNYAVALDDMAQAIALVDSARKRTVRAGVYLDAGENGLFSAAEYEPSALISALSKIVWIR